MKLYENIWTKKSIKFAGKRLGDKMRGERKYYKRGSSIGQKDGSQQGWKRGGRGRNRTDECRHPEIKKNRR